jgi:hypothetical protein
LDVLSLLVASEELDIQYWRRAQGTGYRRLGDFPHEWERMIGDSRVGFVSWNPYCFCYLAVWVLR